MTERIEQPNDDTCWYAVLAMLTGLPLDALPWQHGEQCAPEMYRYEGGFTFDPKRAGMSDGDVTCTLDDWNDALGGRLVGWDTDACATALGAPMDCGIVLYQPMSGWTHIVFRREDGAILDPSTSMGDRNPTPEDYAKGGVIPVGAVTFVTKP